MRKRNGSLGKIGGIMDDALALNSLAEGIRPHRAVALWAETVGEQLAAVSTAEAVRGGVLFVRARSGVWATELTFHAADILTRLNARLGGRVLTDLHLSSGGRGGRKRDAAKTDAPRITPTAEDLEGPSKPSSRQNAEVTPEERIRAIRERAGRALAWKREQGWLTCARCAALYEPRAATRAGLCPLCRLKAHG